ncbi:MAG: thioredoxin family protein [Candidatus Aminicenantes bacterium]|nr:thioredoxin family protein [Candidatus Aminicenantes bacterium]
MEIKILGTGCPRCKEVEKRTIDTVAEMKIAVDIEKVTDIKKIMEYKILGTPGLVINGKVKSAGRIPSKEDIKKWLEQEIGKDYHECH